MTRITIPCRKCGRDVLAEQFVLDHRDRIMVCPQCAKKSSSESASNNPQINVSAKGKSTAQSSPPKEAAYQKAPPQAPKAQVVQRITETKARVVCQKCKYAFIYDKEKKYPKVCPYCSTQISWMINE